MIDNEPLVSIIITSFNRERWIEKAILSAMEQDYNNIEIIISDNNSTDNSDAQIKKYCYDKRIRYWKNESNIGMIENFKLATERANGKYLTYLSSDDYFINNSFVSESVSLINKYTDVLLVLGRFDIFHDDTKKIEKDNRTDFKTEFIKGHELFLQSPHLKTMSWAAALMQRKALLDFQLFEKRCTTIDVLSNLRLMLLGNVAFINKSSYMLRIHDRNATQDITIQQAIDSFIYITEPYDLALKNNIIPQKKLDKWKIHMSFLFAKYVSVQFAPQNKNDYDKFINYVKAHFPRAFQKLRLDFKWNVLIFFFKRPAFSLKFFYLFSKKHYSYLKHLFENGKKNPSEKIKL